MFEDYKRYNRAEAEREAEIIQDLAGKNANKEDYTEAEKIIDKESEPTEEARKMISLFQQAREASKEKQSEISYEFVNGLLNIIDPTGPRWRHSEREKARDIVIGRQDILTVGSGSSGRRIFFGHNFPTLYSGEWDQIGSFFMWYPKPADYDWETSHVFWENWMKHFKKQIIRLN